MEKLFPLFPQPSVKGNSEDNLFKGYRFFGEIKQQIIFPLLVAGTIDIKYCMTFNMKNKFRKWEKACIMDTKPGLIMYNFPCPSSMFSLLTGLYFCIKKTTVWQMTNWYIKQ